MSDNPYASPGSAAPAETSTGAVSFAGEHEYADYQHEDVVQNWFYFGLVMPGIGVLALVLAFVGIDGDPPNPRMAWFALALPIVYLARWYLTRLGASQFQPVLLQGELSPEGLRLTQEGVDTRETWAGFRGYRMVAARSVLLLRRKGNQPSLPLPRRFFRDEDDWLRAQRVLQAEFDFAAFGSRPARPAPPPGSHPFQGVLTRRHLLPYIDRNWERQSLVGGAVGSLLLPGVLLLAGMNRREPLEWVYLGIVFGLGLVVTVLYSTRQRWWPRRVLVTGMATANGLQLEQQATSWDLPWNRFVDVSVDEQGPEPMALLVEADGQAHLIARSFFARDDQWQAFLTFCRQAIVGRAAATQSASVENG